MTLHEAMRRAEAWLVQQGRTNAKILHAGAVPGMEDRVLLHYNDPLSRWEAVLLIGPRVTVLFAGEYWVPPREYRLWRRSMDVLQCECGFRFEIGYQDLPLEPTEEGIRG